MINTSCTRRRSMVSSPPPGIEMLVSQGEKYLIDSEDDIRWGVSRLDNWPDITNTYITRSPHYMKMKAQSEEGLNMRQRRTSGLSPLTPQSWEGLLKLTGIVQDERGVHLQDPGLRSRLLGHHVILTDHASHLLHITIFLFNSRLLQNSILQVCLGSPQLFNCCPMCIWWRP